MNVLGLIVFCTGFGVILSILGEQARLMINFFIVLDAVNVIFVTIENMKLLEGDNEVDIGTDVVSFGEFADPKVFFHRCYPIGILSLVCKNIVDIDNLTETAQVSSFDHFVPEYPVKLTSSGFGDVRGDSDLRPDDPLVADPAPFVLRDHAPKSVRIHDRNGLAPNSNSKPTSLVLRQLQAIATAFGTASRCSSPMSNLFSHFCPLKWCHPSGHFSGFGTEFAHRSACHAIRSSAWRHHHNGNQPFRPISIIHPIFGCQDGTALYEAVAVIFIAQLHNIKLTALDLLTIRSIHCFG